MGAGGSTLIGQTLEHVTGRKKRSTTKIIKNTIIDGTIGAVTSKFFPFKSPGITSGRNNMAAVFKSGLTKLKNKTASRMSTKVIGKGILSGIVGDINFNVFMGTKNLIVGPEESYPKQQTSISTEALYWCAP